MDTRFWGPDGWRLLHSIVAGYPTNPSGEQQRTYYGFFKTLQHILPCIYCRNSFGQYWQQVPIKEYLGSRVGLCQWLYQVHNLVNQKLRSQGLNDRDDPPFNHIYQKYDRSCQQQSDQCHQLPGWNFIYCVLFNYSANYNEIDALRKRNYQRFLYLLPLVLPFTAWQRQLTYYLLNYPFESIMSDCDGVKQWCYNLEKDYNNAHQIPIKSFNQKCRTIDKYQSKCKGKGDPKPTCHTDKKVRVATRL